MQLMTHLRAVRVPGPDGALVPLVAEATTVFQANRPPEASAPPNRWPSFLLAGVLLAALLLFAAYRARTRERARVYLAIGVSTWSVIAGFFGCLLAFLWIATDHTTSYDNQNLLQVNPLSFLLAVAAPLALLQRTGARARRIGRLAWRTAIVLLVLSLAGALLHILPGATQGNEPIMAVALPLHLASVLSLRQTRDPQASTREDVSIQKSAVRAA
jgi:hypothetical protein